MSRTVRYRQKRLPDGRGSVLKRCKQRETLHEFLSRKHSRGRLCHTFATDRYGRRLRVDERDGVRPIVRPEREPLDRVLRGETERLERTAAGRLIVLRAVLALRLRAALLFVGLRPNERRPLTLERGVRVTPRVRLVALGVRALTLKRVEGVLRTVGKRDRGVPTVAFRVGVRRAVLALLRSRTPSGRILPDVAAVLVRPTSRRRDDPDRKARR